MIPVTKKIEDLLATLPPELRTTPGKTRGLVEAWNRQKLNAEKQCQYIERLVDLTVAETIQVVLGAIRLRAEWLGENGVADGTVRHVAYWLESDAGKEALVAADKARALLDKSAAEEGHEHK